MHFDITTPKGLKISPKKKNWNNNKYREEQEKEDNRVEGKKTDNLF